LSRPGRLVVISGPSGVGKSTLIQRLTRHPKCRLAVSATTRPPRPGDKDGVQYHFVTRARFAEMADDGQLLEYADVHGARYGTPKAEVLPWLDQGWTVILDVDPQGFRAVRKVLAATGIFVMPPSIEVLDARLKGRATEDGAALAQRLANAHAELACSGEYDHCIVNDDVARALEEIEHIAGFAAPEAGSGSPN
jgi:guanylate kinase